ncbi:hypothetical protein MASR2M48_08850 [Spirochaetota bacterium]
MNSTLPKVANYNPKTNFCDYLIEPLELSLCHNGIEIKGCFTYIAPADYSVIINFPYSGICCGSHTPAFAMLMQNRNIIEGQLTEKCFRVGKEALIEAYNKADFLFKNKDLLYQRILDANSMVKNLLIEVQSLQVEFNAGKKSLKASLKGGCISQNEYVVFIKNKKNEIGNIREIIDTIYQDVFLGFSDYQLKYGAEKQDIDFVCKYYLS